jgi:hypothetical protein
MLSGLRGLCVLIPLDRGKREGARRQLEGASWRKELGTGEAMSGRGAQNSRLLHRPMEPTPMKT